jgi:hypothetical protein
VAAGRSRCPPSTHVVSGAGQAVVARTGRATQFGAVSARLGARRLPTGFERGITAFGVLLVRAMVVLVTAIFVINLVLHRPVVESLLFSLALAVGLTPQLLPAIVSISLAAGARRMAAEQVIVKRLDAALTSPAVPATRCCGWQGSTPGCSAAFPTRWTRRSWLTRHRSTPAPGWTRSPMTSSASGSACWSGAAARRCWSPRARSTRCCKCAPVPGRRPDCAAGPGHGGAGAAVRQAQR